MRASENALKYQREITSGKRGGGRERGRGGGSEHKHVL